MGKITKYDVDIAVMKERAKGERRAKKKQEKLDAKHFITLNNENGRVKDAQNMFPSKDVHERDIDKVIALIERNQNESRQARDRDKLEIIALIKPLSDDFISRQGKSVLSEGKQKNTQVYISIAISIISILVVVLLAIYIRR